MLMAPGSFTSKGNYIAGKWLDPPILSATFLVPELEMYKDKKEYIQDMRPIKDRIIASMVYLSRSAPVSREGDNGHKTLCAVASHLVGYHDLDPSLACHLMYKNKEGIDKNGNRKSYKSWNNRCLGSDGNPKPWTYRDVLRACVDAIDSCPSYGHELFKRKEEKTIAQRKAASFIEVLSLIPEQDSEIWIKADALYQVFKEYSEINADIYNNSEFGLDLIQAITSGRLPNIRRLRTCIPHIAGSISREFRGVPQSALR
jgi:hypothetical protein